MPKSKNKEETKASAGEERQKKKESIERKLCW